MVTKTSTENCNSERCFLDTGCYNHMIGNKSWLKEIDPKKIALFHIH